MLQDGAAIHEVEAATAARRAANKREREFQELREALKGYHSSIVEETSKIAQRGRMPGLPQAEKGELLKKYNERLAEKKQLEEQMRAIDAVQNHPSRPACPGWRWEEVHEPVQIVNDDVDPDNMEVTLLSVVKAKNAKGEPCKASGSSEYFLQACFPVPIDTVPTVRTGNIKITQDETLAFDFTTTLNIKATSKGTVKAAERRRVVVLELYKVSSGFLGFSKNTEIISRGAL